MILTLLKTVIKHDIRTSADLLFVGTVGDGDLRRVKYLFNDLTNIRSFISIDIGQLAAVTFALLLLLTEAGF